MAKGSDIKRFFEEGQAWPEGYYHEEGEIEIYDYDDTSHPDGGRFLLEPDKDYPVSKLGYLIPEPNTEGKPIPFATAFRKWMKSQTKVTLTVEVDKEKEKDVRALFTKLGYKIV